MIEKLIINQDLLEPLKEEIKDLEGVSIEIGNTTIDSMGFKQTDILLECKGENERKSFSWALNKAIRQTYNLE